MHGFQSLRIFAPEVDTGIAAVVDLSPELTEVRATLVPQPRLREQTAAVAALVDAEAEVDVLAIESHLREALRRETAQLLIHVTTHSEVERAGIELLVELLLATTDAAGRKERGHRIRDGLLDVGERLVGGIGTSPCIRGLSAQLVVNGLHKARRRDGV